jgi:hypothetical protein
LQNILLTCKDPLPIRLLDQPLFLGFDEAVQLLLLILHVGQLESGELLLFSFSCLPRGFSQAPLAAGFKGLRSRGVFLDEVDAEASRIEEFVFVGQMKDQMITRWVKKVVRRS